MEDAQLYLRKVLFPLCRVFPDQGIYASALAISAKTGYSFYDALIISGALRGESATLYTEDLPSGQNVESVQVVNPFEVGG